MTVAELLNRLKEIRDRLDTIHFNFPDPQDECRRLLKEAIRITDSYWGQSDDLSQTLKNEYESYRVASKKRRATRKGAFDAWHSFIKRFKGDLDRLISIMAYCPTDATDATDAE